MAGLTNVDPPATMLAEICGGVVVVDVEVDELVEVVEGVVEL
jgi:hypothetical protein